MRLVLYLDLRSHRTSEAENRFGAARSLFCTLDKQAQFVSFFFFFFFFCFCERVHVQAKQGEPDVKFTERFCGSWRIIHS